MREPIQVELNEIRFEDLSRDPAHKKDPLRFPVYGNLFQEWLIRDHHHWLQPEPAFQFLQRKAELYDFVFQLDDGDHFFAVGDEGKPIYWEAQNADMRCVVDVRFPEREAQPKTCRVRVDSGLWGAARVVTLRILCRTAQLFDPQNKVHGVSLSLIGHGQSKSDRSETYFTPIGHETLHIEATVNGSGKAPTYDIFRPDFSLHPSLGLEPAFRVGAYRPYAAMKIHLANPDRRFKTVDGCDTEVEVIHPAGSGMPAELSRVQCSDEGKTASFSWYQKANPFIPKGIFDFSLQVEESHDRGASWSPLAGVDIDPVLFNDPPPIGPKDDGPPTAAS